MLIGDPEDRRNQTPTYVVMSRSNLRVVPITLMLLFAGCADQSSSERSWEEELRSFEIEHEACRERMIQLASESERYVPKKAYSESRTNELRDFHNAQSDEWKSCANEIRRNHVLAVFAACQAERCGRNIGGGCFHISQYAVYTSTIEAAIEQCAHHRLLKP